ncbi:MAG: shikimate kinase [Chitinophagaceae bacterium]|nr:MAG: shikimate kinase [Chitinophagaceae bacterium]
MKIYLNGFMGAGKTHWGRLVSQRLSIPFFDLDEQIVNAEGKSVNAIFEAEGEEVFRMKEKEVLHLITESHDSFIMACGGGSPCYFNNIEFMNDRGVTVWINTPQSTLFSRLVKERDHRPLLRNLDDDQLKAFIHKKFSDRKIYYQQCRIMVDDEGITIEKFIEKIFHA